MEGWIREQKGENQYEFKECRDLWTDGSNLVSECERT